MKNNQRNVQGLCLFALISVLPGCGGDGADGSDGIHTLLIQTEEAVGVNCANGGVRVDSGPDNNRNGVLDSDEIEQTDYVCHGTSGNSAPLAQDQTQIVPKNSTGFAVTLVGQDMEGDDLNYHFASLPSNGVLSGNAPNVFYTPDPGYSGSDSFRYSVDDGFYHSEVATVTLTVEQIGFSFHTQDQKSSTLIEPVLLNVLESNNSVIRHPKSVDLSEDGATAYIADDDGGLRIVDVSDPINAYVLSSNNGAASAKGAVLSADGSMAFMAVDGDGLEIVDITDSSTPYVLGTYDTGGASKEVALSPDGKTVYLSELDDGLTVVDVSNPAVPSFAGSYIPSVSPGWALGVVLSADGNTAYIVNSAKGLRILDVSDASNITQLGHYDPGGQVMGVALSHDESLAYLSTGGDGIRVVDVSDSTNPKPVARRDTDSAQDLIMNAGEALGYLADDEGLFVVAIDGAKNPVLLAQYAFSGAEGVNLSRDGGTAYVAAQSKGFYIFDVSNEYVAKSVDFGSDSIKLRIVSDNQIPLALSVTADRTDIITVGDYSEALNYDDYDGVDVEIPITSQPVATGVTELTVSLTYADKTVTRTVYLDVI